MKLTWAEKTTLLMLCEIQESLQIRGLVDTKLIKDAIGQGQEWAISFEDNSTEDDETYDIQKRAAYEVIDILDMWSFVEPSLEALDEADSQEVKEAARLDSFKGFDGNGEVEHLAAARFLVDNLGRFEEFAGRINNSHFPTLPAYQEMVDRFEPIRNGLAKDRQPPFHLTKDELIQVMALPAAK